MIAQLCDSNVVETSIFVNQSQQSGTNNSASIVVNLSGTYVVSIFAIGGERETLEYVQQKTVVVSGG